MLSRGNSDAAIRLRRAKSTSAVSRHKPLLSGNKLDPQSTFANAKAAATRAFGVASDSAPTNTGQGHELLLARTPVSRQQHKSEGSHLARQRSTGGRQSSRHRDPIPNHRRGVRTNANDFSALDLAASPTEKSIINFNLCGDYHLPSSRQRLSRDFSAQEYPPREVQPEKIALFRSSSKVSPRSFKEKKLLSGPSEVHTLNPNRTDVSKSEEDTVQRTKCRNSNSSSNNRRDRYLRKHHDRAAAQMRSIQDGSSEGGSPTHLDIINDNSRDSKPCERGLSYAYHPRSLRQKVQAVPQSLRKICSRNLRRSSSTQSQVPVQQMEARQPHHFGYDSTARSSLGERADYRTGDLDSSALPPTPPPHGIPYNPNTASRPRTRVSLKSTANQNGSCCSGSRITSWTDSSSHQTLKDKPLSPVKEDELKRKPSGASRISAISSSTVNRLRIPLRKSSTSLGQKHSLDTQRVYSALMRKMNHSKNRTEDKSVNSSVETHRDLSLADEVWKASTSSNAQNPDATVRMVKTIDEPLGPDQPVLISDSLRIPMDARSNLMSPSIYSLRLNGSSFDRNASDSSLSVRAMSPTGTATLPATQQPSIRWDLGAATNHSQKDGLPNTSNDWRNWASDRFAGLDRKTSLNLMEFQRQSSSDGSSSHRREYAQINGSDTDVGGARNLSFVPWNRLRQGSRLSSKSMSSVKQRVPSAGTKRKPSNANTSASRQSSSSTAVSNAIPEEQPSACEQSPDPLPQETRDLAANIIASQPSSRHISQSTTSPSLAMLNARKSSTTSNTVPPNNNPQQPQDLTVQKQDKEKQPTIANSPAAAAANAKKHSPRALPRPSPTAAAPRIPRRRPRLSASASTLSLGRRGDAANTGAAAAEGGASPINEPFLRGIRKGPYGVASPSMSPSPLRANAHAYAYAQGHAQTLRKGVSVGSFAGVREGGGVGGGGGLFRGGTENTPPRVTGKHAGVCMMDREGTPPTMSTGSRRMVDEFLSSRGSGSRVGVGRGVKDVGPGAGREGSPAFL